jgi:hypothetical protein
MNIGEDFLTDVQLYFSLTVSAAQAKQEKAGLV